MATGHMQGSLWWIMSWYVSWPSTPAALEFRAERRLGLACAIVFRVNAARAKVQSRCHGASSSPAEGGGCCTLEGVQERGSLKARLDVTGYALDAHQHVLNTLQVCHGVEHVPGLQQQPGQQPSPAAGQLSQAGLAAPATLAGRPEPQPGCAAVISLQHHLQDVSCEVAGE